jgi:hypothetical protein
MVFAKKTLWSNLRSLERRGYFLENEVFYFSDFFYECGPFILFIIFLISAVFYIRFLYLISLEHSDSNPLYSTCTTKIFRVLQCLFLPELLIFRISKSKTANKSDILLPSL